LFPDDHRRTTPFQFKARLAIGVAITAVGLLFLMAPLLETHSSVSGGDTVMVISLGGVVTLLGVITGWDGALFLFGKWTRQHGNRRSEHGVEHDGITSRAKRAKKGHPL
jgi:hypothetical protein